MRSGAKQAHATIHVYVHARLVRTLHLLAGPVSAGCKLHMHDDTSDYTRSIDAGSAAATRLLCLQ